MRLMINTAHQRFGGAVQVAISFIQSCKAFSDHDFFVCLGPGVGKSLRVEEFPDNFQFEFLDFGVIGFSKLLSIQKTLRRAATKLNDSNIKTSHLDAEVLLMHTMKKSREWLLAHPNHKLSQKQILDYESLLNRRSKQEPVEYIIGYKEFFGFNFSVNKDVLIPRPETELLVEKAIDYVRTYERTSQNNNVIFIDIGTGSGNIIISLAKTLDEPSTTLNSRQNEWQDNKNSFFAIDNSKKALRVARTNAKFHDVEDSIVFLNGRFLNPLIENLELLAKKTPSLERLTEHSKIIILANLPYLSKDIYESSPDSVRKHEPKDALFSGQDGLDHYRKLLNQIKIFAKFFELSNTILLEISPEQKTIITKQIKANFPNVKMKFFVDLAGKNRIVTFETQ